MQNLNFWKDIYVNIQICYFQNLKGYICKSPLNFFNGMMRLLIILEINECIDLSYVNL